MPSRAHSLRHALVAPVQSRTRSNAPARRAVALGLGAAVTAAMFTGAGAASASAGGPAPSVTAAVGIPAAAPLPADRRSASYTDPKGTRSTYHLFTSQVKGQVKGLVVYLDGDGQYGHNNPTSSWALGGAKGVVTQAGARGYATLSVRTPDSSNTFWRNGATNAAYVNSLVGQIRSQIGTSHTWLVGYSGGAQLITQFLLPAHSASFTSGGAVITGGGGVPRTSGTFAAAAKSNFPLHWYTGTFDDGRDGYNALADAKRGQAYYAGQGFRTSREEPAGLDHSALGTRFGTVLATQLDRHVGDRHVGIGVMPAPKPAPAPRPTPTATPSPSQSETSKWPVAIRTAGRSVIATTTVPSGSRERVRLVVTGPNGVRSSAATSRTGRVHLRVSSNIIPGRSYTYEVRQGDKVRASGTFTTPSGGR